MGIVLFCAVLFAAERVYFGLNWLNSPLDKELSSPANSFTLKLKPGSVFSDISHRVGSVVPVQTLTWSLHARLSGISRNLKAGEYQIHTGMTPLQISELIVSGKVLEYNFRIQEGWTVSQMREALLSAENLTLETSHYSSYDIAEMLGIAHDRAEGFFFPDTYTYVNGDTDTSILLRAHKTMQRKLALLWKERDVGLSLTTPYEALTLASIIEKETGRDSDRAKISEVFNNRLKNNMRLQTDPSVIYGLGKSFDGDLIRKHLKTDGRYNTYTRKGLTPTPISLPGHNSIYAALHPESGNLLYFVGRGDGSSHFSSNLNDHLNAVRRYQLRKH